MDQDEQLQRLAAVINGPEQTLADHLEALLRPQGKSRKASQTPGWAIGLIVRAGVGQPDPVRSIRRALDQLPHPPSPYAVVTAILENADKGDCARVVPGIVGGYLTRRTRKDAREGKGEKVLRPSHELLDDLEQALGVQFHTLGVMIFDASGAHRTQPGWYVAWADFTLAVLRHARLLKSSQTQVLAGQHAERLAAVPNDQADGTLALLLYLDRELGPLDEAVSGRLRTSPVMARLRSQTSRLLGNGQVPASPPAEAAGHTGDAGRTAAPADRKAVVQAGPLDGLPPAIGQQVIALCESIRQGMASAAPADSLTALQQIDDLRAREAAARKKIEELTVTGEQLEGELKQAVALKDDILRQLQSARQEAQTRTEEHARVNRELGTVCQALGAREQELARAHEDYAILQNRSELEHGQLRGQVLQGIAQDLAHHCEDVSRMIGLVVCGEREPRLLVARWNRLDAVLTELLGFPGHPVSETTGQVPAE